VNNAQEKNNRIFKIIPGLVSWSILLAFIVLAIVSPITCAISIIVFDFYWIIRTAYLTSLLIIAYQKLTKEKTRDWLEDCLRLGPEKKWEELYHLIIFPVYNEGLKILRPSLEALKQCHYPKDKMIIIISFEDRHKPSHENAQILEREFKADFFEFYITFHPDGLPGEKRTKGANATWAAKEARNIISDKGIPCQDVIISCFDADTCVDKEYFGCLTYNFCTCTKPHQASYQPTPVYNNNIWHAPSFSRLVEISASFCQMIESMRLEKFVTFSSHSMSFKTLIDIGYWPVDMVSDDSVVYWKAFLFYNGDYRVIPLNITVSMDAAYSTNFFKTIMVQYKQKRRWAWGIENFPFLLLGFQKNDKIPTFTKIRRAFHLLESHVSWAIWAIIITVMAPLPILLGGAFFSQTTLSYNLPRITGLLLNFTLGTSLVWIILSRTILPPRPKDVPWAKNILMIVEWVTVPFIILLLGSTPALDAQTHLMLGKYMEFSPTEKIRKVV
jgi:cellulose synthase/poly-beta-1,6-N-acetylglucosamine synthase-like glycosyltransferase